MFDIFENVNNEYLAQEHTNRRAQAPVQPSGIFVVSIGGSLIVNESGPDAEKIRVIADTISSLHSAGKRFVLVVGGGRTARSYVEAMRSAGANNFELDLLGIHITRANAMLVANAIPSCHKEVLIDILRAKEILDSGKIPVFGGLMPFFTTDSVAALLAEYLGGTFVNLTDVDGIYDSNPAENPGAKRFDEIGYSKLVSLIVAQGSMPGQNVVLDLACCLILQRSRITGVVLNGSDMTNFSNYVNGYSFTGTVIREIDGEVSGSVDEAHFVEKMDEINADIPTKKKRKSMRKKRSEKYVPPNPYQIDY